MEHLKAELEIRGYWDCAKKLPKVSGKCRKAVEEVRAACERGDCFVDPEAVVREAEEVLVRERAFPWGAVALAAVAALAVAVILLYLQVQSLAAQNAKLLEEVQMLDRKLALTTLKLNILKDSVNALAKKIGVIETVRGELKALEWAIRASGGLG